MRAADSWLDLVRGEYLAQSRPAMGRDAGDLVVAELGDHAAAIGAALLGLGATR
jgi:hypothetical protein